VISLGRSAALAAAISAVLVGNISRAAAQFTDQLVQMPKLSAPERGSVQGALAGVGFAATELARGAFRLPLAISTPQERGPLQAGVIPTYSPDSGLSEWGMGWSADLSIKRHRVVGEIDYLHDDLVSPWGRLLPGSDGNMYPTGLSAPVRVSAAGADWLATTSDGTQYRFSAVAGVTTERGVYSWQLAEVVSLEGDRTTLTWTKNASGRPFLAHVTWGGRNQGPQYDLTPSYEPLATPFIDHTTRTALDRRITGVSVSVRDAATSSLRERWHYQLGYREAPFGPAFYLETLQRRFASGELQPAMSYRYELDDTRLPGAALEHYTGLDAVLGALGDASVEPDRAALNDIDADGQPDLEHATELTQIQHTTAGWIQSGLPAATGTDPRCRPDASSDNRPRVLARLTADIGPPHVLYTRVRSSEPVTSEVVVCDRLGHPLADLTILDEWELGPNVRLVDVDRDRRPDVVRVTSHGIDVLHNDSDAQGIRFTALPRFEWSLDFDPKVSWLNDFDGDGNVDVTIRSDDGLWVLFGLGGNQWTTSPTLFRFITQDGEALGRLTPYQLTFVDANKDGLADVVLSEGINVWLYTNRGDSFQEVPVAGFRNVQADFGLPIVADLTGRGNTEVAFPMLGTTYVVDLAEPASGLLASADDGMGSVARFRYARSAPRAGIEQRVTVLDQLTVESSGYDTVSFGYSYGAPVLHTVGRHLVGFESVEKRSPFLTEAVEFLNDDDVSGVTSLSEQADDRTPGVLRFTSQLYDDARFKAVRWLRPALIETGYRSADGVSNLSTTTRYTTYERERCPTVTVTNGPSGQLVATTVLASVAAIPDDLSCLPASTQLSGTHVDQSLDFNYLLGLDRNAVGQITRVTQYGPATDLLVLQEITYDANHRLSGITQPGRGSHVPSFDPQGRLSAITDPLGITTVVNAFDPISDAMRELRTMRPLAASTISYAYDGKERLRASWDDFSGTSSSRPGTSYAYQDATNITPGRIDIQILADATTGTSRNDVELVAADGKTLVAGTWVGDHFALGTSTITFRSSLTTRNAFLGPMPSSVLASMTSADLRARGTALADTVQAGFGYAIQATRTQQAGVVGTTTTELLLDGSELITRVHQPGGFVAESAVDAAGKLVRNTDELGVTHRYSYDALGRLVRIDTPDGTQTLAFDGFGRSAQVHRGGIGAVTYDYDLVTGLLIRRHRLDTAGVVIDTSETRYDSVGRPYQVSQTTNSDTSDLLFDYDGELDGQTIGGQLGRLTRVRGEGWQRSTLFDPIGRPYEQHTTLTGWRNVTREKIYRADSSVESETVTVKDPGGGVRIGVTKESVLDTAGRVSKLKIDGAVLYTLSYDDEGRLARADFTSGEAVSFDYDPVTHRRRGHQLGAPRTSGGIHWDLDPRGLVKTETYDRAGTTTHRDYTYDGRSSLTRAATPTETATYDYTTSGLPASITDSTGTRSVLHPVSTLTVGDATYRWDAAGRVIAKDGWSFAYGGNGQLIHASRPGRQLDFVYDDEGKRLLKRVNGAPVRADLGDAVLTEDHFIELVSIGGVVVGVLDNGAFTALLTDMRGTPFAGPDGTPGLASPYGARVSHLGFAETIDYARLGWDPDLDVVRMGVRDYDAKLSQFLTPDPLFLEDLSACAKSPVECNLYGYALNNPLSFTDPTGRYVSAAALVPPPPPPSTFAAAMSAVATAVRWIASGTATAEAGAAVALPAVLAAAMYYAPSDPNGSQIGCGAVETYGCVMTMGADQVQTVISAQEKAQVVKGSHEQDGTLTFYRGTHYYDALQVVQERGFDSGAIARRQASVSHQPGLYLTTQTATARYYADLAGGNGRGGGPATLTITVQRSAFERLAAQYGISVETPVNRPTTPGQTETLIPPAAIDAFNATIQTLSAHEQ